MEYRLINKQREDTLEHILANRKIKDIKNFLKPRPAGTDPRQILNMGDGVGLLLEHIKGGVITILVDSDPDGYTSAALLYRYISMLNPDRLEFVMHEGKKHGLSDDVFGEIMLSDTTLLVIPDAGSNDKRQIEELVSKGVKVLIIDHHQVEEPTDKAIIVNNQICDITNKHLTGVGMSYKFCRYIDMLRDENVAPQFLDLVAIGQIADSSDYADDEIRYLVFRGLSHIKNPFLLAAIEEFGVEKVGGVIAPRDLSFNLIPPINACIRVGTMEEKSILFDALIGKNRTFEVEKKTKNRQTGKFDKKIVTMNIYQYACDICKKCKTKQDGRVKKLMADLNVIHNSAIFMINLDDPSDLVISGLLANKLVNIYNKPTFVVTEKNGSYTGSARTKNEVIKEFRSWCENTELTDFALGHEGAFGISIPLENIERFMDAANSSFSDVEKPWEVDFLLNKPSETFGYELYNLRHLWGGSVKEPLIAHEKLLIQKKFISMNGKTVINFWNEGITHVLFNTNENIFKRIMDIPGDELEATFIGSYSLNSWNGKDKMQFIVKDFEVTEYEITEDNISF